MSEVTSDLVSEIDILSLISKMRQNECLFSSIIMQWGSMGVKFAKVCHAWTECQIHQKSHISPKLGWKG